MNVIPRILRIEATQTKWIAKDNKKSSVCLYLENRFFEFLKKRLLENLVRTMLLINLFQAVGDGTEKSKAVRKRCLHMSCKKKIYEPKKITD